MSCSRSIINLKQTYQRKYYFNRFTSTYTNYSNSTKESINYASKMYGIFSSLCVSAFIPIIAFVIYKRRVKSNCESNPDVPRIFAGKSCVITGAAGDMGSATAKMFALKGANLLLVDLPSQKDNLNQIQKDLAKLTDKVLTYEADVTQVKEVQNYVQSAIKEFGKIDYFFNNAGIQGSIRPLQIQDDEEFFNVQKVNLFGVYLGLKYVSRAMIELKTPGVIVNTASLAGLFGVPDMSAYVASKFGVVGLTKTAAKELAPYNIRVFAIAPGILEGKMWRTQIEGREKCRRYSITGIWQDTLNNFYTEETEKKMIELTPLKRLGKMDEVSKVVGFLCSDDASYMTGNIIPIDGGRIL